jgi:glycine hydroxymethyltransferase
MMEEIQELIRAEEKRQKQTLMLIPSENYASAAVRKAVGSVLSNKYAEGYPGKRYYQGNGIVDQIENICIERAKNLFGVPHANVQPYSGSPANAAVLMALVPPGEKIMGMKLSAGGHLTHGHPRITFSGKYYQPVQYDVNLDGWIDYEEVERIAKAEMPKLIIAGTTAYPRALEWDKFAKIADEIGAFLLADISHISGLVVAGEHLTPVPFADVVMTTTHKTLRGPRGAMLMVTQKGLDKDPEMGAKIDKAVFPGMQGGPHENTIAGLAIALSEAATPEYKEYARQIVRNAKALGQGLMDQGLSLVTGGTDNHLMVVDLTTAEVSGKEVAVDLENAGIIVNANTIPHDINPPANPSGIRLGTPAVTTRGMKEEEMKVIAELIGKVVKKKGVRGVAGQVRGICKRFPL